MSKLQPPLPHQQEGLEPAPAPVTPSKGAIDITEMDLTSCLSVLDRIATHPDWKKDKKFHEFRKRLFSFKHFPNDVLSAITAKTKQKRGRARTSLVVKDRETFKSCQLSASRLDSLKKLASSTGFSTSLVPDGPALMPPVANETATVTLIPDGDEAATPSPKTSSPSTTQVLPTENNSDFELEDLDDSQSATSTKKEEEEDEQPQQDGDERIYLRPHVCYVCKRRFHLVHSFYSLLCIDCGDFNLKKRAQSGDLADKVALVTGGRVKIGYHCALKLLRAGAHVIITTRFPNNSLTKYASEPDFSTWKDRLRIHALDFRSLQAVEAFATHLASTLPRLDILINNACQTIHRPPAYYQNLVAFEEQQQQLQLQQQQQQQHQHLQAGPVSPPTLVALTSPTSQHPSVITSFPTPGSFSSVASLSLFAVLPEEDPALNPDLAAFFPTDALDPQGQQVDLRTTNTWVQKLEEVQTPELVEVLAINTCAPFILNGRLRGLMASSGSKTEPKFIVNVSAMEGCFNRKWKSRFHPHTNMAKAALNMMTRTSAADYALDSIYMTSVDTGWINDEKPLQAARKAFVDHGFQTPLDEIDAAARVLDPVFTGFNGGQLWSGVFLKDYSSYPW